MENKSQESPLESVGMLKKFPKGISKSSVSMVLASMVVVLVGVVTGWFLSGGVAGAPESKSEVPKGVEKSKMEAGIEDTSTLPDTAEGVLVQGGIEGEGTYHLERSGGPSQNIYLTSTVIDLESFVGKKVKVWGETLSALRAGWLMDVGRVKVIE